MSFIGPCTTALNPFSAGESFAYAIATGEQVIGQAVVTHRPCADKIDRDLGLGQFGIDECLVTILSQIVCFKNQAIQDLLAIAVILMWSSAAPGINGEGLL